MTNIGISLNAQAVINALAETVRSLEELSRGSIAEAVAALALTELEALLYSDFNARQVWEIMMDHDCSMASAYKLLGLGA